MVHQSTPPGLTAFLAAVQARDAKRAAAHLAENVIMKSPIVAEPFVGRELVAVLVARLLDVFDRFEVIEILSRGDHFAVVVKIRVGDDEIEGVDVIALDDDGKVESLTIHLRPLPAIVALQNRLASALRMPVLALTQETGR